MTEKEEEKAQVRKKRKQVCIYGNYRSYYGYRIDCKLSEDPRLTLLKKEWFEGKDCLDIGCNQGLITMSIARKFSCQRILGVDIDPGLIEAAYWNLRKTSRMQCSTEKEAFLKRVSFRAENFIETLEVGKEKYDTILCFSVTKWIHLNWGDDGLVTLFAKIWRLLKQGGILLLEPQPWSSYKSKRQVSEIAKLNFNNILFTPELFREILLDKIGFRSMTDVSGTLSGTITGFNRPVYIIHK